MACEGMNCTISGTAEGTRKFAQELKEFDNNFSAADFKFVDNLPVDRAFKDLKVLPVKELVFYGIENEHTLGEGGCTWLQRNTTRSSARIKMTQ